jgi:alpha-D-xyloside xylohydrolase
MEGGEKLRLFQKGLSGIETWLNNQTNHARMIKIQSPASPSCVLKPTLLNFCHKNLRAALPVVFSLMLLGVQAMAAKMPVVSWKQDVAGVTFTLNPGTLRLNVCNDRIIRVIYSPEATIPPLQDYSQIKKWEPVDFSVKENSENVEIKTRSLTAFVNRSSGAVSFRDPSGKEILSEPPDGGKAMTPTEVNKENTFQTEQTFATASDEYLYGMGQYQDGIWNWRGMPLELRQQNTQVVVPLLVSNRGYGILWNNAACSFLNPCDTEIPLTAETTVTDSNLPKATEDLQGAKQTVSGTKAAATATPKPTPPALAIHNGSFTAKEAGDYVFFASSGDRRKELSIQVDGKTVAGVVNMWTPYAITGVCNLPAGKSVPVVVRGGGNGVKLAARLKQDDRTVFRSLMGDAIDYTVFYGPSLDSVISGYRTATGDAPLLPKWAYGFWQCRERYNTQQELVDAAAGYRSRSLPVDLIVQDWFYWGRYGWGAYQMDESRYPDPKAMIKAVHDLNMHYMISVWPNPSGIAAEALHKINGFVGGGKSGVYDATNPEARKVRWNLLNDAFFSIGTDAWWQDAAEPLDDGNGLSNKTVFLGSGNRLHNVFPLFHSECIYEGQRAANPEKRVCNLTRSAYPGQQRYATVVWSGDVAGNWETFRRQIPAGLNICLAGIPYWTTDCGGFFRPSHQFESKDYNELQARWFEWSTFCPILRIHGYMTKTEIWNWLPETQKILAAYDRLRYRMLPYNYSVAWQVTSAASTIMRALPMDFPNDPAVLPISDEYCFGPSILVAPVTEPKADHRPVYLPAGCEWVDFWSGARSEGGTTLNAPAPTGQIPLFIKAGSILPLGPDLQWAGEKPADPVEIRVYTGSDGSFTLYEDEGDSYRYEKGAYATIPISWNEKDQSLTIGERKGSFKGMLASRTFHVVWTAAGHGTGIELSKPDQTVSYEGKALSVKKP